MTDNTLLIEIIGWLGTIINNMSVIPQIIKTWRTKNVDSLSFSFLLYWMIGCALFFVYSILTGASIPIIVSYALNVIFPGILTVLYLKYRK